MKKISLLFILFVEIGHLFAQNIADENLNWRADSSNN